MADRLKLIRLIVVPFLIISFAIYVCLNLITPLNKAFEISLFLGIVSTLFFIFYSEKSNPKKTFFLLFNWKSLCLIIPSMFIVFVFGFVLSPLVKSVTVDGHKLFGLTALGDYYKHLYILAAIKTGGLPAHFSFFPTATLSYYYGYYLIPAAISSVFSLDLAKVFYFYILTTTFVVIFIVVQICMALFQTWYQRLLAFTLFLFGTGLDILPTLIQAKRGILTANHIEFWSQILNPTNYLVNNLYTALLWVPQHALPALVVLVTGISLLKEKKMPVLWLTLAIWFCVISSTFVSVSLAIWLCLAFIFIRRTRYSITIAGVVSLCFLAPYLVSLSGRGSLLSFGFYMTPFQYLSFAPYWLNCLLTFFTEFGLMIVAIPIFASIRHKTKRGENVLISVAIILPILMGLFIKSSGFNDYSMRSILPSQMALPFLVAAILNKLGSFLWKKVIFLLLLLSFIPSMTGFFYEIHFRLIDRGTIDWPTTELLTSLRKKPVQNLAAIDNEDWVFLIPSYGYQPIFSPRLFDSGGYISQSGIHLQASYADDVNNLFIFPTHGSSQREVYKSQQNKFQQISQFFNYHQSLNFIVSKKNGTKNGLNPWSKIFEISAVEGSPITSNYTIFNSHNIYTTLKSKNISVNSKLSQKIIIDKSNHFLLNQGLWSIVACSAEKQPQTKLEFENNHLLFDTNSSNGQNICTGVLYYQSTPRTINISPASKFQSLYIAPVTVNTISFLN